MKPRAQKMHRISSTATSSLAKYKVAVVVDGVERAYVWRVCVCRATGVQSGERIVPSAARMQLAQDSTTALVDVTVFGRWG